MPTKLPKKPPAESKPAAIEPAATLPAPPLTPAGRKALRAQAHHLDPVVMVGDAGLTPSVMAEIEKALRAHQLIKIRILGDDRDLRNQWLAQITEERGCAAVQHIGKLLIVWRPNPKKAEKTGPKPKKADTRKSIRGSTSPVRKKNASPDPRESRDFSTGRPPRPSNRQQPVKGPAGLRPAAKPSSFRSPAGRFGDPQTTPFARKPRDTDVPAGARRARDAAEEPVSPARSYTPRAAASRVRGNADSRSTSAPYSPAPPKPPGQPVGRRPAANRPAASRPVTAGISKLRKATRSER